MDVDWIHVAHSKGQRVPFCETGSKSSGFKNCGEFVKTRNYQFVKDFTQWTYLQIVEKVAIDLRVIFSNKDTC